MGRADLAADLGVHDQLGQHRHPFLQKVQVAIVSGLAQQLEGGHPVIGHRVLPLIRRRLQTPTS